MSQIFVSPGVYTKEIDESFVPVGAGAIGGALIGLTRKGPAFLPIQTSNYSEHRDIFGSPDPSIGFVGHTAKSYHRNSGTLTTVRVLGRNTADTGTTVLLAFPTAGSLSAEFAGASATNNVLGVLRTRESIADVAISGVPTNFAISIPSKGVTATNLSLDSGDAGYIKKVLGTDPTQVKSGDSLTALYVDAVFDWNVGSITGSVSGLSDNGNFTSATAEFNNVTGGFSPANSPIVVSQNFGGSVYDLFKVVTRSDGSITNNSLKISITQVDLTTTGFPSFTLVVRDASDSDSEPIVLETFSNLSLDPTSKQYIGRVIGDRRPAYDLTQTPPEILYDGEFANKSNYIRVVTYDGYPQQARPSGFKGVSVFDPSPIMPSLPTKLNELNNRSEVDANVFMGIDYSVGGVNDRLKKTITSASGSSTADNGLLFFASTADLGGSGAVTSYTFVDMVGSNSANFSSTNKLRFTMPVYDGWDGFDPRSDLLEDSNDGSLSADFDKAIRILSNPEEVDFNLIAVPGIHSSSVGSIPDRVIDMVTNRADAFYILDIADATTTGAGLALSVSNAITEAEKYNTNYASAYYPWVRINDSENDKLIWVPPTVEVMGAYAFNDRIAQPWWAVAGFNRASLDDVVEVRRRLTQGQRDDLYNKNVNPIATFPSQGIVIFGQKTLQKKASALDRVSVRRMMIEVRKTIAGFSRLFTFEPNDGQTRTRLLAQINEYLASVQAQRGIVEFRAILDETTTTPDLIDRNIMKGKIFLKPTSSAEIILLDFNLSRSGASFSDV